MSVGTWIRTRPVTAFFVLVAGITVISWGPMLADRRGVIDVDLPGLFFLGGLAPGVAAYVVMRVLRGADGDAVLLGPLLRWRVGAWWYVAAVGVLAGIWAVATSLAGDWAAEGASLGSWSAVLLASVRYLFAAVPEEVGWRGFAVPALQERHSALATALLVGFAVFVWLYNNSRGSLLVLVLAHAVSNVVGLSSSAPVATAALTAGVAVLLVIIFGPEHLSRATSRPTLSRTSPEPQGAR